MRGQGCWRPCLRWNVHADCPICLPSHHTCQMYALLAIVTALCPTANRLLDEAVTNTLREK